jgi:hypothetical protein
VEDFISSDTYADPGWRVTVPLMTSRLPRPQGQRSWFRLVRGACLHTGAAPSVDYDRGTDHRHRRRVASAEIADPRRVRRSVRRSSDQLARSRSGHVSPGLPRAASPRSAPPSAATKRLVGGEQVARCQCANHWLAAQSAWLRTTGRTPGPDRVHARRFVSHGPICRDDRSDL